MADLVVYAYNGPGEQTTAETLAQGLPAGWSVIAGRALPTPQKDDVDLMVVGENFVFVVEVKHWGPKIEVLNGGWRVKGQIRESPVGRNAQVARITAGVLKRAIGGYNAAAGGKHLVTPKIVLSYPAVELDTSGYPYDDNQILFLDEGVEALKEADASKTGLSAIRDKVVGFLSGLAVRQEAPTQLGSFTITAEVEGVGRSRVFVGNDLDGDAALLRAYPKDGWGPGVDVARLVRHERVATKRIAELQRAWSVEATFVDDARRWIVLPVRPVPSVSLARHAAVGQIEVRDEVGRLTERARHIVADAFEALAEVHQKGVVHRGLMPSRVLLAKNDRVLFRDFYLAHATEEATIVAEIADTVDGSAPFRAPEVAMYVGNASEKSDVYSLALTLLWWIHGDVTLIDPDAIRGLGVSADDGGPVSKVLAACLVRDAGARPTAESMVDELRRLATPVRAVTEVPSAHSALSAPAFVEGGHVGVQGRYRLQRPLGQGGFATSWLAIDTVTGAARVIKEYSNPDSAWLVKQEFEAAEKLSSPRCARVWDYSPASPVFLVSEYIDGQSLRDFAALGTASEEDYRQVALDALEGLAYMHSVEQFHRDISPTNVIVRADGRAVLIDFGLSAEAKRAVSVAGTPPFMAPEVAASGTWTPSADLYALGVTMIKVMLARYPYLQSGPSQFNKTELRYLTAEEIETWGPAGGAILNALFRLVEPDPASRPSSAAEFAEYLRTVSGPRAAPGVRAINPTVASLRRLYRGSTAGNAGNRGLDDDFARATYVPTRLDTALTPDVIAGKLDVVLLTGNPGDGKTAFLATLREALQRVGATDVEAATAGGWRMKLADRTFAAVYDASEARAGRSSDDLMHEALAAEGPHTALIAVNDGRLLSFFSANQDIYPECYLAVDHHSAGRTADVSRIAIVDLKRRSLARTDRTSGGLAGAVLDSFTADRLWTTCETCTARTTCPILGNRDLLMAAGRDPLLELVEVSHLRRKRRATFRDVRSAFAWTITGDRGCGDVHHAVEEGRDLRLADDALAHDLAFDEGNPDYLVAEWAEMDPGMLAAPSVERSIRDGSFGLNGSLLRPGSHQRQLFFDGAGRSPVGRADVRAYRYLDEFVAALAGRISEDRLRTEILSGLSRILGAHGYAGTALALRDGESDGWSVLREIGPEQFRVAPVPADGPFVEQQPDGLRISHRLGSMVLRLDSFELVRRAADGEILGDADADAVKLELSAFADLLRRNPGKRVLVVDPAGRADAVSVADGVVTRTGAVA